MFRFTILIVDPRPSSSFFNDAFRELLSACDALPGSAACVFISPTPPSKLRQMVKKSCKGLRKTKEFSEKLIGTGESDSLGRLRIYTTSYDADVPSSSNSGSELYNKLGLVGGSSLNLTLFVVSNTDALLKAVSYKQEGLVDLENIRDLINAIK